MTDSFSINFLLVLPELVQCVIINVLLAFALCFSHVEQTESIKPKVYRAYHLYPTLQTEPICMLIILGLICSAQMYNHWVGYDIGFDTLIWDPLSRFMTILLCLSAAAALCLGLESYKRFSRYEFLLIIWLSILGMISLIKSYNFLALYLSVELQSLSFYMLASMRSRSEASAEAALKYFILSAFSSAIMLLGMCLIYGTIGTQNLSDLALSLVHFQSPVSSPVSFENGQAMTGLTIGLSCICVSLLFKLGAAPFHAWIADVYEGSPMPITAFFAICSKIAVATILIRMLRDAPLHLIHLITGVALLSLIIGSLSAMRQVKLKRLLAFSGVANVGWFLLALVVGQWQLLAIGLVVYNLLIITLFSVFINPLFRTHPDLSYSQRTGQVLDYGAHSLTIKYVSDLNQIYQLNPSLAFAVIIAMFSLAGIPPLAGFYSKYLIINALTQSQSFGLLAIALGAAVISAFYYVRVIKSITSSAPSWFSIKPIAANAMLISCTSALTVLFFVKPDYVWVWLAF